MNNKHFRNTGRGSVYTCQVCDRRTRYTGNGTDCCAECFEIAGIDNMVNDNGSKPGSKEHQDALIECNHLLEKVVAAGGNGEKIKSLNTYIWI